MAKHAWWGLLLPLVLLTACAAPTGHATEPTPGAPPPQPAATSSSGLSAPRETASSAGTASGTTATSAAPGATPPTTGPPSAVLAAEPIAATSGGDVSADGVTLSIPAHALSRDGTASISQPQAGVYDLAINVPWSGAVTATLPLSGPEDAVVHYVNGAWTIESSAFGDASVQVTHLSPFSSLSFLAPRCLRDKTSLGQVLASCLLQQGVNLISKTIAKQIAGNDACLQHLIDNAGGWTVLLSTMTGACVGQAGETWHDPASTPVGGTTSPAPTPPTKPTGTPPTVPNGTPAPSGLPVFAVQNTSETPPDGVWFRNSPHTADTARVTGLGIYMGERVQLRCFAWGDSVGPYSDTLWYQVANVTRPTNDGAQNSGWLNAHYVADGLAANQVDPGVPAC